MKPVNIAILSCNHGHAKGYYGLTDNSLYNLVGVSAAPDAERLDLLDPTVPIYKSDEELYAAHPELEAVIIASDNESHLRQTKEAARRGLHIFSMKVPTFDPEEYREMVKAVEDAGVICEVELEMRNHAPVYRVRELIESGAIGELLSLNFVNYSHNPVWWRPWQCDPKASFGDRIPLRPDDERFRGGALADHPHVFDLARYLTGSTFEKLYAEVSPNIREGVETEDMVHIIGRMENGVLFSIDPSYANDEHHVKVQIDWEKYPQCVEVFMSAVGTKGVITADLYNKHYYNQRGKDGEYMCNMPDALELWDRRMQHFYTSIRHGVEETVSLRDHFDSVMAMHAGYESIEKDEIVKYNIHLDV